MPYIKNDSRRQHLYNPQGVDNADSAGELNYAITMMIQRYLGDVPNYQKYNDVIGVLECAKLELYRRKIAHYEDYKKKENGDVY